MTSDSSRIDVNYMSPELSITSLGLPLQVSWIAEVTISPVLSNTSPGLPLLAG